MAKEKPRPGIGAKAVLHGTTLIAADAASQAPLTQENAPFITERLGSGCRTCMAEGLSPFSSRFGLLPAARFVIASINMLNYCTTFFAVVNLFRAYSM